MFVYVTERENNGSQDLEMHDRDFWASDEEGKFRFTSTPPDGQFPLQNISHIKFEPPKVPVVFVLGKFFLFLTIFIVNLLVYKIYYKKIHHLYFSLVIVEVLFDIKVITTVKG